MDNIPNVKHFGMRFTKRSDAALQVRTSVADNCPGNARDVDRSRQLSLDNFPRGLLYRFEHEAVKLTMLQRMWCFGPGL